MLAAVAVVVLASGGAGVFGPLGSVISGHGSRSATESAAVTGATGSSSAPIVAAPGGSAVGLVGGPGGRGRSAPGGGGPQGRSPGNGGTPAGGLPTIPVPPGAGGGPGPSQPAPGNPPPPPQPPPSQAGQAIDAAGDAVQQIGHQTPAVQPITDPVGSLTHQVADTCRRLPVCP
jgi:hypothetical protein